MEQAVIEFIIGMAAKFPVLIGVFAAMGVLRAIFKPLMGFLRTVVQATPTLKDDEWLDKIMASKPYQAVAWFIDYIASIKLPGYDVK